MADPVKEKPIDINVVSAQLFDNVGALRDVTAQLNPALLSKGQPFAARNSFDYSLLNRDMAQIKQTLDGLINEGSTVSPSAQALAPQLVELQQRVQEQFQGLITTDGKKFDRTIWEGVFKDFENKLAEITDPAKAPAGQPTFTNNESLQKIQEDLKGLKEKTIDSEVSRLNDSVKRQLVSQRYEKASIEAYGGDKYLRKQFVRIDNPPIEEPMPEDPSGNFVMSAKGKPGMGEDGFYRRENSDYIIQFAGDKVSATYSPIDYGLADELMNKIHKSDAWWHKTEYSRGGEPFSFKEQMNQMMDALATVKGAEKVTFEYPNLELFSHFHVDNINIALDLALEKIKNRESGKPGVMVDFDLGAKAMQGLMSCTDITDKRRQETIDKLERVHQAFAAQKQKDAQLEAQAKQAAAPTPTGTTATAAAPGTPPGTTATAAAPGTPPGTTATAAAAPVTPTGTAAPSDTSSTLHVDSNRKPEVVQGGLESEPNSGPTEEAKKKGTVTRVTREEEPPGPESTRGMDIDISALADATFDLQQEITLFNNDPNIDDSTISEYEAFKTRIDDLRQKVEKALTQTDPSPTTEQIEKLNGISKLHDEMSQRVKLIEFVDIKNLANAAPQSQGDFELSIVTSLQELVDETARLEAYVNEFKEGLDHGMDPSEARDKLDLVKGNLTYLEVKRDGYTSDDPAKPSPKEVEAVGVKHDAINDTLNEIEQKLGNDNAYRPS